IRQIAAGAALAWGVVFLARHDTESGHVPVLAALGGVLLLECARRVRAAHQRRPVTGGLRPPYNERRRLAWIMAAAWGVPLAALVVSMGVLSERSWARPLVDRCRFGAAPGDDIERLAVWCREHTPASAVFVGPPGPKTFRLWSERNLAFNRSGSPYHAAGLAVWSERFRHHVAFQGSLEAFVHAYLRDRHGLERRYESMTDADRARLAIRQGASFIIAAAPSSNSAQSNGAPLELVHVEGRYAVYRVRQAEILARGTS